VPRIVEIELDQPYLEQQTKVLLPNCCDVCMQHSWVIRLREKFKKYRSRSKAPSGTPEAMRMKEKYGRKRSTVSTLSSEIEEVVKVQRVYVRAKISLQFI